MPEDLSVFEQSNAAKACFDEVYNAPDPRLYYATLGALNYEIPSRAKPVFRAVMNAMNRDRLCVLDIGCSYGVNAALLKYDLEFEDLVSRYADPDISEMSSAEVVMKDADAFANAPVHQNAVFLGLDVAREAAGYAKAVGLLDGAICENLEEGSLSPAAAEALADVDLVITTGAVGYVTRRTFERIIDACDGSPPWVAAFALRQFPFDEIGEALTGRGLDCGTLDGALFPQRSFRDREEMEGAIEAVIAAGCDPGGVETNGGYVAEFHLAAPDARRILSRLPF